MGNMQSLIVCSQIFFPQRLLKTIGPEYLDPQVITSDYKMELEWGGQ